MPFLVFLLWLAVETVLTLQLSAAFGAGPVLLWLLASIALGVVVIRRAGWRAVRDIQHALARNEAPARELMEALLRFLAGVLLMLPGPLSDLFGLVLLLPVVRRPAARSADARMRAARPDLREPVIIEGEFEDITPRDPDAEPDRLPRRDD